MSKHAYCIIAHSDPYCLQKLVEYIDDKRNDIIILFDRKTDESIFSNITTNYSTLSIVPFEDRVDIKWGNISQVEAELVVFQFALSLNNYQYIHLLSGQDLPLKSQDYIHNFFNSLPFGTNLVGLAQGEYNKFDLKRRSDYYYFFTDKYKHPQKFIRIFYNKLRALAIWGQKILNIRRRWKDITPYKGCNWVSITPDFAKYLIDRKKDIISKYRLMTCADEIYKQTILMNSPFKNTIFDLKKDFAGGTRLIDWERGHPYTWRSIDIDELKDTEALFGRKFNSTIDKNIINSIGELIK